MVNCKICIPDFLSLCSSGCLVTGLVREFLEYFDLDFSIAVFDPETNFVSDSQIYMCYLFIKLNDICHI